MDELRSRASKIKLIAFDVDGVLTNGEIIYNDKGEEFKIFNAKDGHGICALKRQGLVTAIITARKSPIVDIRAKDLEVLHVYQGQKNKLEALNDLLKIYKYDYSEVAYVGDDTIDICILDKIGFSCCPDDAVEEVKAICHFVSTKPGGKGAVREISDFILQSQKVFAGNKI